MSAKQHPALTFGQMTAFCVVGPALFVLVLHFGFYHPNCSWHFVLASIIESMSFA